MVTLALSSSGVAKNHHARLLRRTTRRISLTDAGELEVELLATDRPLSLTEDRIDLAVRISSQLDSGLVARCARCGC